VTSEDALAVARRYHDCWTGRHYEQAVHLLAPTLEVEVPINDYPTPDSFAQALRGFGDQVTGVELLSALGDGEQAMLLYDMEVDGLGSLRVAEHFTVAAGRIVRLRQIHDTAAIREWR
jgi:ketosteroid isomerase-like protein